MLEQAGRESLRIRLGEQRPLEDCDSVELDFRDGKATLTAGREGEMLRPFRRLGKNFALYDQGSTHEAGLDELELYEDAEHLPLLVRQPSQAGGIRLVIRLLPQATVAIIDQDIYLSGNRDSCLKGEIRVGDRVEPVFCQWAQPAMRCVAALCVHGTGGRITRCPISLGGVRMILASKYVRHIEVGEEKAGGMVLGPTMPFSLVALTQGAGDRRSGYHLVDSAKPGTTWLRLENRLDVIRHHGERHRVEVSMTHARMGGEIGTRYTFRIHEEEQQLRKGDGVVLYFDRLAPLDGVVVLSRVPGENKGEGWRDYFLRVAGIQPGCSAISYDEVPRIKGWGRPSPGRVAGRIAREAPVEVDILYATNAGQFWKREILVGTLPRATLASPRWPELQNRIRQAGHDK